MKISNLFYLKYILDFATAWTGWWDQPHEGEMVSITSSEPLSKQLFSPWNPGQPNGGRIENCAHLKSNGHWNDWPCAFTLCVACQIPTTPIFVMKGNYNLFIFTNWCCIVFTMYLY